jgi:hypothetical protein
MGCAAGACLRFEVTLKIRPPMNADWICGHLGEDAAA